MYAYFFLFAIAFLWILFAVIQDLRTREISNWLNFSLLSIGLLYRGFYALLHDDPSFFWWGALGTLFFVMAAYGLYYGRAFAGGDAKLLMGLGPFVPIEQFADLFLLGFGFIFALFLLGSLYSLSYTLVLIPRRWNSFRRSFIHFSIARRGLFFVCLGIGTLVALPLALLDRIVALSFFLIFLLFPFLYAYGKAIEKTFFIKRVLPRALTEGDWLVEPVTIGKRCVMPSVHGLSLSDIKLLQRTRSKVLIKEGIPFSPAFLLAFGAMVFYVLGLFL